MIWFVFLNVLWATFCRTQMIQFCCNPGRGIGGEVVFQRLDHTFLPVGARAWCRASGDFSTSYWDLHHKMLLQVITREAPGMINLSFQRIFYFWQCLMIRFYTDIVFFPYISAEFRFQVKLTSVILWKKEIVSLSTGNLFLHCARLFSSSEINFFCKDSEDSRGFSCPHWCLHVPSKIFS